MKIRTLIISLFTLVAAAVMSYGCSTGADAGNAGDFRVNLPSSDSVDAKFTDTGQAATVVGGPIQGTLSAPR